MTSLDALNDDFRDFLRDLLVEEVEFVEITGVGFDEAWESRVPAAFEDARVSFLGREALIRNKRATGRAKDLADAESLES